MVVGLCVFARAEYKAGGSRGLGRVGVKKGNPPSTPQLGSERSQGGGLGARAGEPGGCLRPGTMGFTMGGSPTAGVGQCVEVGQVKTLTHKSRH